MFLKPLEAQSRGKTLEMIIAKRMQNMVHFENKNIIFVAKIHFDIFCIRWKITGGSGSRFSTRPKGGCRDNRMLPSYDLFAFSVKINFDHMYYIELLTLNFMVILFL